MREGRICHDAGLLLWKKSYNYVSLIRAFYIRPYTSTSQEQEWNSEALIYPLWQRKQLLVQRQQNLTEFLVIWISSTRNPASFVLVGRSRLNKKTFTYNHKLSRLYWLNFSLQKQHSVGFNKLHTFKMIAKRYVQKTTKGA